VAKKGTYANSNYINYKHFASMKAAKGYASEKRLGTTAVDHHSVEWAVRSEIKLAEIPKKSHLCTTQIN
jgi:hypothetical protein